MPNTFYFVTKILKIIRKHFLIHNEGLLIINKLDIHWDSYFEMSILYYFQQLVKKKKRRVEKYGNQNTNNKQKNKQKKILCIMRDF